MTSLETEAESGDMRERAEKPTGVLANIFQALTLIQADFLQESQVSRLSVTPVTKHKHKLLCVQSLVGQQHSVGAQWKHICP